MISAEFTGLTALGCLQCVSVQTATVVAVLNELKQTDMTRM